MPRGNPVGNKERQAIIALYKEGNTQSYIQKKFGRTHSTIKSILDNSGTELVRLGQAIDLSQTSYDVQTEMYKNLYMTILTSHPEIKRLTLDMELGTVNVLSETTIKLR